jgi:NTE family protein
MLAGEQRGVVLALGGGGAAGLAHVGVLQVLVENNIHIRAIAGTSIGAEIGAFHASGMPVEEVTAMATAFDWKQTLGLFLPDMATGGLVSGTRITRFLRQHLGERRIEDLSIGFASVAADLESGEQIVIDSGDLVEAVRASVSLPGLVAPYARDGRMLVDGGVVNPLPFDVAREHFGGPVIAVAVLHRPPKPLSPRDRQWLTRSHHLLAWPWMARVPAMRDWLLARLERYRATRSETAAWSARRVLERALEMSLTEIMHLRASRHPPDLMLTPEVADVGRLEFYRAKEAIAAGRRAAEHKLAEIRELAGVKS